MRTVRIALDLQSLKTTGSRHHGIGRLSLTLAKAMIAEGKRNEFHQGEHPHPEGISWLIWKESTQQLKRILFKSYWAVSWEATRGFCWQAEGSPAKMVANEASIRISPWVWVFKNRLNPTFGLEYLREGDMKKALITGITGQDGAYLSQFLLEKGVRLVWIHFLAVTWLFGS